MKEIEKFNEFKEIEKFNEKDKILFESLLKDKEILRENLNY